eukprot:7340223-Prymnesium_polylepis.2
MKSREICRAPLAELPPHQTPTLVGLRAHSSPRNRVSLSLLSIPPSPPLLPPTRGARNARGGERRRQRRYETAVTVVHDRYIRRNRHPKAPTLLVHVSS